MGHQVITFIVLQVKEESTVRLKPLPVERH